MFKEVLNHPSKKPFEGWTTTPPSVGVELIRDNLVQRLNDENRSNFERRKLTEIRSTTDDSKLIYLH